MDAALFPAAEAERDKCRSKFMVLQQISNFVCSHVASGPNLFVCQLVCFVGSYQSRHNPQQPEKDA